ncbi:hypothetical protein ACIPC1_39760 [Streptomyces sp. NPDC087263]
MSGQQPLPQRPTPSPHEHGRGGSQQSGRPHPSGPHAVPVFPGHQ